MAPAPAESNEEVGEEAINNAKREWSFKIARVNLALKFFAKPENKVGANKAISLLLVHDHNLETSTLQWVYWDDFKKLQA